MFIAVKRPLLSPHAVLKSSTWSIFYFCYLLQTTFLTAARLLNYPRAHVSNPVSHGRNSPIQQKLMHLYLNSQQNFLLTQALKSSVAPPATPGHTVSPYFHSLVLFFFSFFFYSVMKTAGRKVAVKTLEAVPGWWALKSTELSAECTLKDVKFSPLLCCSFFSFNLTISLSLSPDCIRIDCNLSKCLLWLSTVQWSRRHAMSYFFF